MSEVANFFHEKATRRNVGRSGDIRRASESAPEVVEP
jgi:hypothetical protein